MVTERTTHGHWWDTLRTPAAATVIVVATCTGLMTGPASERVRSASQAPQTAMPQTLKTPASPIYRITFTVTQTTEFAADSKDQITIIFSDRSWGTMTSPPAPLFGEDIAEEFSFSAADFEKRLSLTFTRIVRDLSFLSSRYIRVINHGNQGWGGGSITMLVNGRREILNVTMRPRKGNPTAGIKGGNPDEWKDKTYWEEELDRIRAKSSGS